jgi:hypothetical protein
MAREPAVFLRRDRDRTRRGKLDDRVGVRFAAAPDGKIHDTSQKASNQRRPSFIAAQAVASASIRRRLHRRGTGPQRNQVHPTGGASDIIWNSCNSPPAGNHRPQERQGFHLPEKAGERRHASPSQKGGSGIRRRRSISDMGSPRKEAQGHLGSAEETVQEAQSGKEAPGEVDRQVGERQSNRAPHPVL